MIEGQFCIAVYLNRAGIRSHSSAGGFDTLKIRCRVEMHARFEGAPSGLLAMNVYGDLP